MNTKSNFHSQENYPYVITIFVDRPASSASDSKLHRRRQCELKSPSSSACCACFPSTSKFSAARNSVQLSEVYCPACIDEAPVDSPSCLTTISKKKAPELTTTLLDVVNEIEYSKNFNKKLVPKQPAATARKEQRVRVDYEIACEAGDDKADGTTAKTGILTENEKRNMVRADEDEERPSKVQPKKSNALKQVINRISGGGTTGRRTNLSCNIENNNETTSTRVVLPAAKDPLKAIIKSSNEPADDNNNSNDDNEEPGSSKTEELKYSTLPMVNNRKHKKTIAVPQRITADGTKIFYICDVPKKLRKGSLTFSFIIICCFL